MKGVSGHDSALLGFSGPVTTWAKEMNFVMNIAPGTGSIARPVGQWSSALPLNHGCSRTQNEKNIQGVPTVYTCRATLTSTIQVRIHRLWNSCWQTNRPAFSSSSNSVRHILHCALSSEKLS